MWTTTAVSIRALLAMGVLAIGGCETLSLQTMSMATDLAEMSSGVVCDTARSLAERTRKMELERLQRVGDDGDGG